MQNKKYFLMPLIAGMLLVLGTGLWLATARPVQAQCGSQASSCKNCHEVEGQKPVNSDGTGWHQSHAFGDFCYLCHAGNQQATDMVESHTGMVPPLSDVKASCQQCHPKDLQERAQVYATTLGVEISGGAAPAAPAPTATTTPAATSAQAQDETPEAAAQAGPQPAAAAPVSNEIAIYDPNLVDYSKNYDEIVLGRNPANPGIFLLTGLIGLLIVGGGYFLTRKNLVKVTFGDTKKVSDEFPADVVDMLPAIASLKSNSRKSLKKVLDNPIKAEKILGLMDAVVSYEKTGE